MKPWNKDSVNALWVFGTASLVAFFILAALGDYLSKGGPWCATLPILVASGYGIYNFVKTFRKPIK